MKDNDLPEIDSYVCHAYVGDVVTLYPKNQKASMNQGVISCIENDGTGFYIEGSRLKYTTSDIFSLEHKHFGLALLGRVIGFAADHKAVDMSKQKGRSNNVANKKRTEWGRVEDFGYTKMGVEVVMLESVNVAGTYYMAYLEDIQTVMPVTY